MDGQGKCEKLTCKVISFKHIIWDLRYQTHSLRLEIRNGKGEKANFLFKIAVVPRTAVVVRMKIFCPLIFMIRLMLSVFPQLHFLPDAQEGVAKWGDPSITFLSDPGPLVGPSGPICNWPMTMSILPSYPSWWSARLDSCDPGCDDIDRQSDSKKSQLEISTFDIGPRSLIEGTLGSDRH